MSMELLVAPKGNKYVVEDNNHRVIYSVKKKVFSAKYNLYDASDYVLYTLIQEGDERKPSFTVLLNDGVFLKMVCKSLFLDPTIYAEGKDMKYSIASKDRRNFDIILNDNTVGKIRTKKTMTGDSHYDIEIENKFFDDYIPLFAVAIDKAFGEMNK